MDRRTAMRVIARAGARGFAAVEFTTHAFLEAMVDDGVSAQDVFHVLAHIEDLVAEDDFGRKWKAYGPLVSGDRYAVVTLLLVDKRVRVITTHDPP
jgi:hypothetical protein